MNFCEFIQLVVEGEAKLEEIRLYLANLEMFEPFTVFKQLDQPRTSALRIEQLQEFLEDNAVEFNVDEINYIFRVLDSDSDSFVTYEDFKKKFYPKLMIKLEIQHQDINHLICLLECFSQKKQKLD